MRLPPTIYGSGRAQFVAAKQGAAEDVTWFGDICEPALTGPRHGVDGISTRGVICPLLSQ
jgi:hypothetical protein